MRNINKWFETVFPVYNFILISLNVFREIHDAHWQIAQQEGRQDHPWTAYDGVISRFQEASSAQRYSMIDAALGLEDYKLIVKKPTDLNLIRRQNN